MNPGTCLPPPHNELALLATGSTASVVRCRGRRRIVALGTAMLLVALMPRAAVAQETGQVTSKQVWGNFVFGFPRSERLYFEVDFEPKLQFGESGADRLRGSWNNLDVTSLLEYYPRPVIDLTAELVTGYTQQSSDEESFEITMRLGFRLHFVEQIFARLEWERFSSKRFSIANFTRVEHRYFRYSSDDLPSIQEQRFRNRLELKVALNHDSLAADGTWYLLGDIEFFAPLGNDVAERFATKSRVRLGFGRRKDYSWRFEALAQLDRARNTLDEEFDLDAKVIVVRMKRTF